MQSIFLCYSTREVHDSLNTCEIDGVKKTQTKFGKEKVMPEMQKHTEKHTEEL